jgi:hypothetical protein
MNNLKTMSLKELLALQLDLITKPIKRWYLLKWEEHYTMCAETEDKKAKESSHNAAHYQMQAALIRSRRSALR